MIKRTLSTIILWLVVVGLLALFGLNGGIWLLAIFSVLSQYELYCLLDKADYNAQKFLGCLFGLIIILGAWYFPRYTNIHYMDAGSDLFTIAVMCISLTVLNKPDFTETRTRIMPTLFGLLLVPYMLHFYILLVYHFDKLGYPITGLLLALWIAAVAKFTDIGGLLIGKALGKHKLAKDISPGKTWEGAIGGIITASLAGGLLIYIFAKFSYIPAAFTPRYAAVVAIPIAIISIASDLIESVIKRNAKVKDSGNLIPGIGGIFDLTDSLLLSAPCGFLILKYTIF